MVGNFRECTEQDPTPEVCKLGLKLNEEKTHTVNAWKERFDFLGFSFGMRRSRSSGKNYPHTEPSKRSIQRVKTRIKELTNRRLTLLPLPILMKTVNCQLAGWSNYFYYGNCSTVFGSVKMHVEERMRTHLRKRHKLRSRALSYARFTNNDLYQRVGLYKLPTTAAWKAT